VVSALLPAAGPHPDFAHARPACRLRNPIPPALDLIVLSMETGQSLDQSLADTSRNPKRTYPNLSAELAQLYLELRASTSRADSYRALCARNKEPELRKLANLLMDSDRFGLSISAALRSHSKYLRTRFRQQAKNGPAKSG
jgi:tight adherence protein C